MNQHHNGGGPAFPWCGDLNECPTINLGLSIRDYFAAKAMQGFLAKHGMGGKTDAAREAEHAYIYADAMLEARK